MKDPKKRQHQRVSLSLLSAFSLSPAFDLVGLGGLEPPTSRLSGVRSNQLSYRPSIKDHYDPSKLNNN
jgi:hypothetical protein